jgi:hypothetical protein
MDYSVDVVGDMVAGAASHYCFDHTPFGGIVIPTTAGRSTAKCGQCLSTNFLREDVSERQIAVLKDLTPEKAHLFVKGS